MLTANFLNDLIYFFYDIQINSNLLKLYFVINQLYRIEFCKLANLNSDVERKQCTLQAQKIKDSGRSIQILTQENYYEKIKLIGQGTFGKVYIVISFLFRRKIIKTEKYMQSNKFYKTPNIKIDNSA